VLPGICRELLRLLREPPATKLRERLAPGVELTDQAFLRVLVEMELLREDYLRLGRVRAGAREFQQAQDQQLKRALHLARQVAESRDGALALAYVASLAGLQGALEAKTVRNEWRRAWWHVYAARLAELYMEIDPRAGWSATGPAVRFVRAGLEHCCGLSIGEPDDVAFPSIGKAVTRWRNRVQARRASATAEVEPG
jgi:hypothetical protein